MKKSILAAAIAAAVAAPAANAGVVLYGKVHVSIDYLDETGTYTECLSRSCGTESESMDLWQVKSRASRIGFKGTEDLGNGLKAIWKAETGYDFADGKQWNAARNAYIGLAGDWGTFLYGRHDTPYKIAFYSTGVDMLGDSILDMNSLAIPFSEIEFDGDDLSFNAFEEVRASNAIAYISPNMNGLTIAAAIVPGEGKVGNGLADFYSVAAMYSNNGLKLAAAYESMEGDIAFDDYSGFNEKTLVGAGYTMNNLSVSVAYAMQKDLAAISGLEMDTLGVSASYGFGNNKLILAYSQADWEFPAGSDLSGDSKGFGIALQHNFSKRTSGYIAYSTVDGDLTYAPDSIYSETLSGEEDAFSIGMVHNF